MYLYPVTPLLYPLTQTKNDVVVVVVVVVVGGGIGQAIDCGESPQIYM